MKIINYFDQTKEEREYWKSEIKKCDWRAAKYLYCLLDENRLCELCGNDTKLLLLIQGKNLVSFCTLAEQDEIAARDLKPWIGFVYTFPEYRGNRYSEKIIKYALEAARNAGYSNVYISSDEVGLYEKYGFQYWENMKNIYHEETQVFIYNLV
ncbi:MAG: GNAT family N-acetyltransferase [Lachnospiraceae bacterium]|nr:GNAT family N-acetyltransferase [Lachnospiraceae bacterium]